MAKMMSGKQVNFLRKLVHEKVVDIKEWREMLQELDIKKEDDLYHLNVEQASQLIWQLMKMSNK